MGVKSTTTLTWFEAVEKYVELRSRQAEDDIRREAMKLSFIDLENYLERMNDALNGGEGFENFMIVPEK